MLSHPKISRVAKQSPVYEKMTNVQMNVRLRPQFGLALVFRSI